MQLLEVTYFLTLSADLFLVFVGSGPFSEGGIQFAFCLRQNLTGVYSRFPSLLAAGDVSQGGTSATQRQKFHTDDVKSVRNPVRSADWSTEWLHCFSCCLRMTDKRQKATKVKCKRDDSLIKQPIFVEYILP